MPGGSVGTPPLSPDEEWQEDREIFSRDHEGKLFIPEEVKRRWDKKNPRKFTPEAAIRTIVYMANGSVNESAAAAVGICRASFQRWMALAEKPDDPYSTEELRAWKKMLDQAEAMAEARAASGILEAGQAGQWTAYAWYLERRYPQRWGRKDTTLLGNPDGSPLASGDPIKGMNSEQMMLRLRALLSKGGAEVDKDKKPDAPAEGTPSVGSDVPDPA